MGLWPVAPRLARVRCPRRAGATTLARLIISTCAVKQSRIFTERKGPAIRVDNGRIEPSLLIRVAIYTRMVMARPPMSKGTPTIGTDQPRHRAPSRSPPCTDSGPPPSRPSLAHRFAIDTPQTRSTRKRPSLPLPLTRKPFGFFSTKTLEITSPCPALTSTSGGGLRVQASSGP